VSRSGRWLLGFLRPYRGLLLLGVGATALASVLDAITVVLLLPLLRHLFGSPGPLAGPAGFEATVERGLAPLLAGASPTGVTVRLVALLWVALLAKNVLVYLAGLASVRAQEGLVRDVRSALFEHLLRLDLNRLERTRGGQFAARVMGDADQLKVAVSASLASFFQNLVVIAATLALMAQLSWRLTGLTLAAAPALLIGIRALLRRLRRHARARAEEAGEMTATVSERVSAIKLIRASGAEARESARFRAQADRYRRQVIRTQQFATLTAPVSELFGGLLLVVLIAAGAQPGLAGAALTPQALLVFIVAALRLMPPLKAITQFPSLLAGALASADRVFEVLALPPAEPDDTALPRARFEREIRFEGVWFSYGPEHRPSRSGPGGGAVAEPVAVLKDVSFTIRRGQVVALVGPSGAGKTTLAELLPRLREPTAGQILLDGVPLAACSRGSVRALMGFVGQETIVLHDTVHANIAYGRPDATRAQVEQAARAAHAHGFIVQLPQGYDTVLGERGTRLSGGQRQRIAIARALLRDPPILILDEATSALDSESERLVQDALLRLMRDRTVLVIAHRLATVRHADLILVLDGGRVVEQGTHEELLAGGGVYRTLSEHQFALRLPARLS
jgi:subfamily B ATP-binding cassette protein MsbA